MIYTKFAHARKDYDTMFKNKMTRHNMIYTKFMKHIKQFKLNKKRLSDDELRRDLYKILIMRGQYREAKHQNLQDKYYQRSYRQYNKDKIRKYHAEYARKRRANKRAGQNV